MRFRCVWCGREQVPEAEGGCDDLELAFHEPDAGDDNGLCDACWAELDAAMRSLADGLFGWLPAAKGGRDV